MPLSEARRRANKKSDEKYWEYCTIKVHKGRKAEIDEYIRANCPNKSRNQFINDAIDERMERIAKTHDHD